MIKTIVVALVLCFMEIAVIVMASPLAKRQLKGIATIDDSIRAALSEENANGFKSLHGWDGK